MDDGKKPFRKWPSARSGEPRRPMQKTPSSLGGLLGGMLARHGIGAQVLAARVVLKANEVLDVMLNAEQRSDFKIVSFSGGVLVLICRNAGAKFFINPQTQALARKLEEALPEISVTEVRVELRPDDWVKAEAWES